MLGSFAFYAVGIGTENVGKIAPHFTLVDQPRETTRTGQDTKQRNFGQTHRTGPIIDEQNLIARQRQLVPTARTCAIDGREKLQSVVTARVLHAIARLISKLAEVDLPGMGRRAQHINVGACAEHPLTRAGQHNTCDLGMLEADALQDVVQLHIDTEIV